MATATFEETFRGRNYRVCTEVTGERESEGGNKVHYERGHFKVEPPAGYSEGYLIVETDAVGQDAEGATMMAVGTDSLRRAEREYGPIKDLPPAESSGSA